VLASGCGLDSDDKDSCNQPGDCVDGFTCNLGTNTCDPTGAGPDAGADWDSVLQDFIAAVCSVEQACFPGDPPEPVSRCIDDITTDMADARAELDVAGEQACIECMRAKTAAAIELESAECNEGAVDINPVFAACDLDSTADFDGDGIPDNDDDEACAGYP